MKTQKIFISGIVQGVNFRSFIKEKADEFDIKGYVRNLEDGRVEIIAQGSPDNLREFLKECNKGPIGSRVKNVISEDFPHQDFLGFKILRN